MTDLSAYDMNLDEVHFEIGKVTATQKRKGVGDGARTWAAKGRRNAHRCKDYERLELNCRADGEKLLMDVVGEQMHSFEVVAEPFDHRHDRMRGLLLEVK